MICNFCSGGISRILELYIYQWELIPVRWCRVSFLWVEIIFSMVIGISQSIHLKTLITSNSQYKLFCCIIIVAWIDNYLIQWIDIIITTAIGISMIPARLWISITTSRCIRHQADVRLDKRSDVLCLSWIIIDDKHGKVLNTRWKIPKLIKGSGNLESTIDIGAAVIDILC